MHTVPDLLADVQRVLERADPGGLLVRCEITALTVGPDVLDTVDGTLGGLLPRGPGRPVVLLLVDRTPIRRDGVPAKEYVAGRLAERFAVRTLVLDDGHPELHASDEVIDQAVAGAAGAHAIVTVGGGTITDIGKVASARAGGLPLVVVQTAASVDGYTDNVSVVLRNGVKRTIPSRWPDAVIADTTLIAQAPAAMNRAGYGEINSMFTAPADWLLAALLGFEHAYHPGPIDLLAEVGKGIEHWSPGLATGDRDATDRLVRALDMRGIATGVAGTTACLSGVEHLISHMLDISQAAAGRPTGLHGAQVGVGSVVAAAAWQLAFERIDADPAAAAQRAGRVPDLAQLESLIAEQFGPLDPSGRLAEECWRDYSGKLASWTARRPDVQLRLAKWPEYRDELGALVRTPEGIAAGLRASGSPAAFADLDPQIPPDLARWAVANCALMRNRFTVVDLLMLLGWWTDRDVTAVLERAGRAASGEAGPA